MTPYALLVGIAAGLASGLLFAGIVLQSSTALGLAFAAPIPVAIASLGWGTAAGFVAAFTAAGLLFAATGLPASALTLLITMTLPTAVAGHLAGLARPRDDGPTCGPPAPPPLQAGGAPSRAAAPAAAAVDWYPLSRVFQAIVLMSIAACVAAGWLLGFDPAGVRADLDAALLENGAAVEGFTPEQVGQVTQLLVDIVPFVQPAMLVLTLVAGLYLGAAVTRVSGRLPRAKDDLPSAARLPKGATALFAAGLLGAFLPGTAGLLGSVVAGAYFSAFSLVGLAVFHQRTRGRGGRGLLLFTSYAAIALLAFPIVVFTVLGVVETGRGPRPPAPSRA